MYRHELSDQQWARIDPFFIVLIAARRGTLSTITTGLSMEFSGSSTPGLLGGTFLNATGPGRRSTIASTVGGTTGPGSHVTAMLDKLDDLGNLDHDLWCIDGTIIQARRAAAGARRMSAARGSWAGQGGSAAGAVGPWPGAIPGRLWTKVHLACDGPGIVVGMPHHGGSGARVQGVRADPGPRLFLCRHGRRRRPGRWRGTRATVTRGSGVGAGGAGSSL